MFLESRCMRGVRGCRALRNLLTHLTGVVEPNEDPVNTKVAKPSVDETVGDMLEIVGAL